MLFICVNLLMMGKKNIGDDQFISFLYYLLYCIISISRPFQIPNIIKSGSPPYRVQPGKIEDYTPGFSSVIADKKEVGNGFLISFKCKKSYSSFLFKFSNIYAWGIPPEHFWIQRTWDLIDLNGFIFFSRRLKGEHCHIYTQMAI